MGKTKPPTNVICLSVIRRTEPDREHEYQVLAGKDANVEAHIEVARVFDTGDGHAHFEHEILQDMDPLTMQHFLLLLAYMTKHPSGARYDFTFKVW